MRGPASGTVRLLAGPVGGLVAYGLLLPLDAWWEEAVAAALLGAVAGCVAAGRVGAWVGAAACGAGWMAGALLFGVVWTVGLGAWIVAGATVAGALGLGFASPLRGLVGLVLGAASGLVAELSRYVPVLAGAAGAVDMQLVLLLTAGTLLPASARVAGRAGRRS